MSDSDVFRVCIMGRYYDIPTSEISNTTLESLKCLLDDSNNINPLDLLRTFLEYSEINNVFKNGILKANQKLNNAQNLAQNQTQQPHLINQKDNNEIQEAKESENNVESLDEEVMIAQSAQSDDISSQSKSS